MTEGAAQERKAVEFSSFISNEAQADIGFEEVMYDALPAQFKDKSIIDLHIRRNTGANIIGFKKPDGSYIVNPPPDTVIVRDSSFIILGQAQFSQWRFNLH